MTNTKKLLLVGAAVASVWISGAANAEDPAHGFIDRLSGQPFKSEGHGSASAAIETNPAKDFIDQLGGTKQLVAERSRVGTADITTDSSKDLVERLTPEHTFTVNR